MKPKRYVPFKPANTGKRPILFTVPPSEDYNGLNECFLEVKVRLNTEGKGGVSDSEGAASTANLTKYVYCVNSFGHTLFNQMNVHFNGVSVSEQSNAYHQKAYIETLLNYNREKGRTISAPQGWVNEVQVKEEFVPSNANNDDQPNTANWDEKNMLESTHQPFIGQSVSYLYCTTPPRSLQNRQMSCPLSSN